VLHLSSLRITVGLETSRHGPPHPIRDGSTVANTLAGIHNAMTKCLFVVNRIFLHMEFYASPTGFKSVKRSGHVVGSLLPIHRPWKVWHVTQNRWNVSEHHGACTTFMLLHPVVHLPVALTDYTYNRKPRQWFPVTRCSKTCWPTNHGRFLQTF
jgi:hypothetical protein